MPILQAQVREAQRMSPPPLNPLHFYLEMSNPQGCLEMLSVATVATRPKAFPMELQFNSISNVFRQRGVPYRKDCVTPCIRNRKEYANECKEPSFTPCQYIL